jgi:DNA modification methylase/ParB-like chromosome segregation protein Spo0J
MAKRPEAAPPARAVPQGIAAVYLPLGELRPNPRNPRAHGAEVVRLARTILRTTWGAPIIAQASTRRIIGGHGRLEAARMIAEGVEVDGILRGGAEHYFDRSAPGPLMVPVRLVDVSDAEADAMTLADNARALQGNDDAAAVVAMATAAFERDADVMRDMGYGAADLDALVRAAGDAVLRDAPSGDAGDIERHEVIGDVPRERIEVEEDEAPVDRAEELRAKWGVEAGQLWAIPSKHGGEHRILCGDSTKAEDVARVMAGDVAAVLHTDPPYGVDVVGGTHDPRDEKNYQSGNRVENDALNDADLERLVASALANCRAHMTPGGAFYVWHPSSRVELFCRAVASSLAKHRQIIVWVKPHFVFGRQDYHWQHEPCFYGWVDGAAHRWENDRKQTTVWQVEAVGTDLEKKLHPTAKPLALPARAIQNHTAPGDVVIEPFSGSGSTMVAAEQTGRLCRAIEIAPKYVAVALERLAALGLEPRLVS